MLTKRQKEVYDFIAAYVARNQISPTFREIADHLGIKNRSNVHAFLKHMETKGVIRKSKDKLSRSVELVVQYEPCAICGKNVQVSVLGEETDE